MRPSAYLAALVRAHAAVNPPPLAANELAALVLDNLAAGADVEDVADICRLYPALKPEDVAAAIAYAAELARERLVPTAA